ncbi:MAG: hypothetical protein ACYSWU_03335 [Planctomycetota bacterium]|jgi:hypothetical protein
MNTRRGWLLLIALLIWTAEATAEKAEKAEKTAKIDRSIAKEPVYQTKKVEYWLLVFGPKAKTRIWVVHDGEALYVDCNGDRDLTAAGERVPLERGRLAEPIKIRAGKAAFTILSLHRSGEDRYYVKVDTEGRRLQYATVKPAGRREDAPILHFDGPLVMGLAHTDPSKQPLKRGSKPYEFAVLVTTAGPVRDEAWGPVIDHGEYVPADAHPVAEFEFSPRKAGAGPIKLKAVLSRHC